MNATEVVRGKGGRGLVRRPQDTQAAWCDCRVRAHTRQRFWVSETGEWGPWHGPEVAPCCGQPLKWFPAGTQRYQAERALAETPFADAYEAWKRDLGLKVPTVTEDV